MEHDYNNGQVGSGQRWAIKWSTLGIAGLITGVGSLGALAIVAAIKDVDALSTVALALAVLAFVVQILIFIAQAASATQQNANMQAINSETKALLEELRARALATNELIAHQFNRVLDGLLRDTTETVTEVAREGNLSTAEVTKLVGDEVRLAVEQARETLVEVISGETRRSSDEERLAVVRRHSSRTWPNHLSELKMRDRGIGSLSDSAAKVLRRYAARLSDIPEGGGSRMIMLPPEDDGVRQLEELEIITRLSMQQNERFGFKLTKLGSEVARLIIAKPPDMAEALAAFPWLASVRDDLRP